MLEDDQRQLELARMLGNAGESEIVLEHAAELISNARG
jgi:DNA repair ATPase RecN